MVHAAPFVGLVAGQPSAVVTSSIVGAGGSTCGGGSIGSTTRGGVSMGSTDEPPDESETGDVTGARTGLLCFVAQL